VGTNAAIRRRRRKLLCEMLKHVGDVIELIRDVPLDKRMSRSLPPAVRQRYEELVDAVRTAEREREQGSSAILKWKSGSARFPSEAAWGHGL
jgi:hypothetical protein